MQVQGNRFTVFSDVTGTGTGDFIGEFDTVEEATAFGGAEWTEEVGYTIHDIVKDYPPVVQKPPTHPERDYPEDGRDSDSDEQFEFPGANSALRRATLDNPRNLPCPTCGKPNRLTPKDVALGYQCDHCADAVERGQEVGW